MSVWVIRPGRGNEFEQLALDSEMAVVGWHKVPDLSSIESLEALESCLSKSYPANKPVRVKNHARQLWKFATAITKGDLVVMPLRSQSAIAVGTVDGDYQHRTDLGDRARHTRPVRWLRTDVPRTVFPQDLLYSFGAMQTIYRVRRDNAAEGIRTAINQDRPLNPSAEIESDLVAEVIDLEQAAYDQVLHHIGATFKGHALATLVGAVLKAQGYLTKVSPPGPDGGVDIVAGSGPMGFDSPRLCVQVKSSVRPVGVKVFRELRGAVQTFNAEQGLLVSWGGFHSTVFAEAASSFFTMRLWDSGHLLAEILKTYPRLPKEIQAAIPLKHIWTMVPEE